MRYKVELPQFEHFAGLQQRYTSDTHILRLGVRNINKHRPFRLYDACVLTILPIYKSFVIQTVLDMKYPTSFRNPNPHGYIERKPRQMGILGLFFK